MRLIFGVSASLTRPGISSLRLDLVLFEVRMWRIKAWPRLTLPLAVFLKRFFATEIAVSHLAAFEAETGLDLVAFREEADGVVLLGLEVMLIHVDAELDLFELDVLLRLL